MNTERVKRKLSAIFSADVEGYSRLMGDDEAATVHTIEAYRKVFTDLIEHHRGRVVDSPGDNLLAEFGSVVDAVQCAVEVQQILKAKNAELPENRRMRFRIGVNLGDVIQEGERIYGDGVNIAARIEGLAEGGGICVSGSAYEQIENKLALGYEYLGEHTVKNIVRPIRVYKVPMEPGISKKKAGSKGWKKVAFAAAVLILGAGVLAVWHYYLRPPQIEPASVEKMSFPLPEKPSIAVLPFENLSDDPAQENIVDGITDAIITGLSRTPEMFVIARNSVFTYKGKPVKVKQVSEDLGVRYVLEGSVQKEGDRLRINVQLIDAIKGHHLWAEKYDRDLKDLFALQDEISMKVITELQVKLTEGEYGRVLSKGTKNIEAYLKFLNALQLLRRDIKEDILKSRKMFEEVIALDPNYPRPYIMLGFSFRTGVLFGWSKSPKEDLARAEELARKALELDDSLGLPHRLLAEVYGIKKQRDKAVAEAELAVSKDPNTMTMYAVASTLNALGSFQESVAWYEKILRLDPYPPAYFLVGSGMSYFNAERYEDALGQFGKLLERAKKGEYRLVSPHRALAAAYSMLGQEEKARHHAAEVLRLNPKFSLDRFAKWYRSVYINQADADPYINALRKAGLPDKPPVAVPEKPSIAVLPFANISGDPKEDYLSDGITENIITALSKVPEMLVIARNSVFTYKGKPVMVQQVGEDLGVRYVLEGSVLKSGDKLRITAQLIDAKTGNHLWAEKYDRDLKDLFELQDDITKNVITALQVKLTAGQIASALGKGTRNLEAYLKVMKGVHHFMRVKSNDNEIARQFFEEAIELDPNYANAYTFLGWTYNWEAFFRWTKSPAKSYSKAVDLAKKAISLDGQYANAYGLLANAYVKTGQFEKAIAAAKKSLSLQPSNAQVNFQYGNVLFKAGKSKEGIPFLKKAIRLDPKYPGWALSVLGWAYFWTGQNEKAVTAFRKNLSHKPKNAFAHASLGCALIATGKPEKAVEMLERASNLNPNPPSWYKGNLAVARLGTGKPEEAITMMQDLVSRHPDDAEGYRYLSQVLASAGKYEEALSTAKKAISLRAAPVPPYYYWYLGTPYLMIGEYEAAIAAFKKSISPWPENIGGHIGLTAAYSLAGRMEEARAQAAEVLRINPEFSLQDVAKNGYYTFQKADMESFINALRKAGLK